jgi:vanillate O-demethylase monooxygenase subunit
MQVRSYPTAERCQWIWAWMGDPTKADEALIPDHREFGLDDGQFYKVVRFLMEFRGSYQLLHENLLDVSHITYLHEGSFDSGAMASTPATTEVDGNRIRITREVTEVATGAYALNFGLEDGTRVRRTLRSETWVPSLNVITNIFEFLDEPGRPPARRHSPFAITPETVTSCHYFVASASNYGQEPKGDALVEQNRRVREVFVEDQIAVESIQQSYDELGAETPDCSVKADEAALRFRRILNQMIAQEAASLTLPRSEGRGAKTEACQREQNWSANARPNQPRS